ncbi:MAG TPA: alpha-amylase family glycosyl hydrolase [Roseiflexaceae bacterium]|nr:alpha-amylase family glycosyl hydrolase [Roseiflexaceae bacterium]
MADKYLWWQRGIIYQIYPRSFMDSNGDGIGDLPGIAGQLDYLRWLGVDAIWLSPIYPSPMADFGYDVADYTGIDPMFGTLADFDTLMTEAHARGLKVMLDFVPNHSSDEHPWFVESRASRDNPKRDWYIWRDPAPGGGPPNNWLSYFGGSAWEQDAATGQYYLHLFDKKQPDLNWRNPAVQTAMLDALRFWLDRGVDGFRVDVIWLMIKDEQFRDNPPNPDHVEGQRSLGALLPLYSADQPEVHDIIAMMRRLLDQYDERMMVGEIYLPLERLMTYYGVDSSGTHLPFNFQLILLPWGAHTIGAAIEAYEAALPTGGWPNWVLGNHDQPRIASRIGAQQARVAAMLLLTLRGTPTMYYGDEIGMHNVVIPPELAHDPQERNQPGLGLGRDPERTPMQWNAGPNAGFSSGTPWLPLADDYQIANVEAERDDPHSMLTLYQRLIALRRGTPALEVGSYTPVPAEGDLLAYLREGGDRRFLIALNLGQQDQSIALDALGTGRIILSTHLDRADESVGGALSLRADEGVIVELA